MHRTIQIWGKNKDKLLYFEIACITFFDFDFGCGTLHIVEQADLLEAMWWLCAIEPSTIMNEALSNVEVEGHVVWPGLMTKINFVRRQTAGTYFLQLAEADLACAFSKNIIFF